VQTAVATSAFFAETGVHSAAGGIDQIAYAELLRPFCAETSLSTRGFACGAAGIQKSGVVSLTALGAHDRAGTVTRSVDIAV
jgi:hypothetical protein